MTPKYLIKFCREIDHANLLLDGHLFMRPAASYHDYETKYADPREGGIIDSTMIYKNPYCYIYCLTTIYEENGICSLDSSLISRFNCEKGFIVILEYEKFKNLLKQCCAKMFSGCECSFGFVEYRIRNLNFMKEALLSKNFDISLFTKGPSFSIEKEFRIATSEQFDTSLLDKNDLKTIYKIFDLGKNLYDIGIVVSISSIGDRINLSKNQSIFLKKS